MKNRNKKCWVLLGIVGYCTKKWWIDRSGYPKHAYFLFVLLEWEWEIQIYKESWKNSKCRHLHSFHKNILCFILSCFTNFICYCVCYKINYKVIRDSFIFITFFRTNDPKFKIFMKVKVCITIALHIFGPTTLRTNDPSDQRPFGPTTLRTNDLPRKYPVVWPKT